jgi:geranylgeranyl diphosphate synthase type II
MSESLTAFMAACQQRIDLTLDQQLPLVNDSTRLREAMRYGLFSGGKRVRPVLVRAAGLAIAGTLTAQQEIILDRIGAAMEAIHAYSLVHDDLPAMDDDDLRRGKPTCHIAFDEALAILAGDALQTFAFELISNLPELPPVVVVTLIQQLAKASGMSGMVVGQAIDLAAVNHQLDLAQLENMHRHKTGALIRASVVMGAVAMGADAKQLQALEHYAAAVGLSFQVQDDILDVIADTATLGKQQGADAALNKPTYVSLLGLTAAQHKAKALHEEALAALSEFATSADYLRQISAYIIQRGH